jgi:PAB1-binding protein PBP1
MSLRREVEDLKGNNIHISEGRGNNIELISDGGGLSLLLVRSFYYFEVLVGVKLRFDDQPYTGGCQRSDKSLTLILTHKKGAAAQSL